MGRLSFDEYKRVQKAVLNLTLQNLNSRVSSSHLILKDKIAKKGKKRTDMQNFVSLSVLAFSQIEKKTRNLKKKKDQLKKNVRTFDKTLTGKNTLIQQGHRQKIFQGGRRQNTSGGWGTGNIFQDIYFCRNKFIFKYFQ